jgi:SNF2 family DNA or RNA helicase
MALLEELTPGVAVKGLLPGGTVTIISVKRHGSIDVELVYQDASGNLGSELLYSDNVANLHIAAAGLPSSFDADGGLFRLTSEAYRIRLAYLFDPLIAVHTSLIEPLPHQITAVYETMLTKQPLRYLLADDPGAGKTIMSGLLIKELLIRGDLRRCLIIAPGNLVEQWQDELHRRFHLTFDILTNDRLEASASGNAFSETPLCIARLDKLSRNEQVQDTLRQTEWDLVIVDEAHKMSATFFGGEVRYTRRYQLGELLGKITRHLVLLTATPHTGKEVDFQLFLRLLDADRFEGRFRDGVHKVDVADLMRHLVKEQLYTFEGTPLFPERFAYTVNYQLSGPEEDLYQEVTNYVRQEFNRADALDTGRRGTVGFALTTLQRRLASSPEAIYQSLKRRRERLERRLHEAQQARQDAYAPVELLEGLPALADDDLNEMEDAPEAEREETGERVVDQASAARTIAELDVEITLLARLEALALQVRRSGTDRKWEGLASLLQNNAEMFDAQGTMHAAGSAPFLDYRPLREEEQAVIPQLQDISWLKSDLEEQARSYAITELVPRHLAEIKQRREAQIDKTSAAVNDRLTTEISYWDNRAAMLKVQEAAGKINARLNSQIARQRAEELLDRLDRRLSELEQERKLSPCRRLSSVVCLSSRRGC